MIEVHTLRKVRESASLLERLEALTNPGGSLMRQWLTQAKVGYALICWDWNRDEILGWLLAFEPPEEGDFKAQYMCCHVFVDPRYRRQHIGRDLLRRAVLDFGFLSAEVHDEASEHLFTDPMVQDKMHLTWRHHGCLECGGTHMAVGLVNGKLARRPCGICGEKSLAQIGLGV